MQEWEPFLADPARGLVPSARPAQLAMARAVADILENGGHAMIQAGTGTGKCLKTGTLVLRHDGRAVKIEDVRVGDTLMGPDGGARTVLNTNTGHGPLYNIVPVKGRPWTCNGAHVLSLVHTTTGRTVDVELDTYVRWSAKQKHLYKLFQPGPVEFPKIADALDVSPYFLGAWLGDGTKGLNSVQITKPDAEIEQACRDEAERFGLHVVTRVNANGGCPQHNIVLDGGTGSARGLTKETRGNPLLRTLKALMADGVRIPYAYRCGSFATRAEVLAGLLDTDGHKTTGCYEIVSKYPALADDIMYVARSLGLRATDRVKRVNGVDYVRVFISGDTTSLPLRIARKAPTERHQKKDVRRTGFRVESAGDGDFHGVALDGDHRFLLGDFTVTHNSLAYATPAFASGLRVVIATGKKALQAQLQYKDLPRLAKAFGSPQNFFATLKGKANYACRLRYEEADEGAGLDGNDAALAARFGAWMHQDPSGDMANFGEDAPFAWQVRVQDCVKADCPYANGCGYLNTRNTAGNARVLVVNHSLLAYDLRLGGGKILGPYDALILDEAHEAPRFFEKAFSYELAEKQADQLERAFQSQWEIKVSKGVREAYKALFRALERQRPGRFVLNAGTEAALTDLMGALGEVLKQCKSHGVLPPDAPDEGVGGDDRGGGGRDQVKLRAAAALAQRLCEGCAILLTGADAAQNEYVPFIEQPDVRGPAKLVAAPLEVGPLVAPALLHINKCVYTSATLTSGNGFNFFINQFGLLPPQVRTKLVLPSPFDYQRRSVLWVARDVPFANGDRSNADAVLDAKAKETHEILKASRGGAFVVAPSYTEMRGIYDRVWELSDRDRRPDGERWYNLLLQQTSQVDGLVAEFKGGWNNALFGVRALSAGVDVPGLRLRCVIITGLMFPHFDDVLNRRRKEALAQRLVEGGQAEKVASLQAFDQFDVQLAGIELSQTAGRLIRTEFDFGVLVLLDPRMHDRAKSYTASLRRLIPHPPCSKREDVLKVLATFAGLADKAAKAGQ